MRELGQACCNGNVYSLHVPWPLNVQLISIQFSYTTQYPCTLILLCCHFCLNKMSTLSPLWPVGGARGPDVREPRQTSRAELANISIDCVRL